MTTWTKLVPTTYLCFASTKIKGERNHAIKKVTGHITLLQFLFSFSMLHFILLSAFQRPLIFSFWIMYNCVSGLAYFQNIIIFACLLRDLLKNKQLFLKISYNNSYQTRCKSIYINSSVNYTYP